MHGLVCKANGRARTIVFPFWRRREKNVIRCFTMYFWTWFSIPAYYTSIGYWKLSQHLHILLLWWSVTVVNVLRSLKSEIRECISPRKNKFSPLVGPSGIYSGFSDLCNVHSQGRKWLIQFVGNLHDCINSTNWSRKHGSLTIRSQKSMNIYFRFMLYANVAKVTKTTV